MRLAAAVCLPLSLAATTATAREPEAAQPAIEQSADSREIVVTGDPREAGVLIRAINAVSDERDGRLARFQRPVCASVTGLSEESARQVKSRIAELAVSAGLDVGKLGCAANLIVVLSPDGPAFLDRLKKERREAFAGLDASDIYAVQAQPGPVWAWHTVEPKRADGGPVLPISQIDLGNGRPEQVPKGAYQVLGAQLSRLSDPVRHDMSLSFVVIDQASAVGLTLQQIADFAAVAGLTGARVDRVRSLARGSILRLFADKLDGAVPEESATPFDLAYLRARYSGAPSLSADQEIRRIVISLGQGAPPAE